MDNFNNTIYFQRLKEQLPHVKGVYRRSFGTQIKSMLRKKQQCKRKTTKILLNC